ncbi:hypothetical protein FSP39_007854 [Pinctada imbricata]|uniref:Uncharacterized protein n=1 Tax=Pinctada imbricata TaxID=66713 RepID=A0AA88Y7P6_PINIB|nr:hypothetical protein FSP39_007854 [Pinctada imbricata]
MLDLYDTNLNWRSNKKNEETSSKKNVPLLRDKPGTKQWNSSEYIRLKDKLYQNVGPTDKLYQRVGLSDKLYQHVGPTDKLYQRVGLSDKLNHVRRNISDGAKDTVSSRVNNVVFLKLHKSASTTVQNIFLRYGFFRNLSFVLPRPPGYYWRNVISLNDTVTKRNILPPPKNRTFNILCSHVIYNRTVFRSLMPQNTKFIGIIREPRAQFMSTLKYVQPHEVLDSGGDPLENYLKNPRRYESLDPRQSLTNNRMAVEFGFPLKLFQTRNSSEIQQYIQKLDKEFDLVILVEKIEESLILMKRILGWNIRDIIYITQNKNEKKDSRFNWTNETERRFHAWNYIDIELYNYFKTKMYQRILEAGETLQQEVAYFRWVLRQIQKFCADNRGTSPLSFKRSKWSEPFKVFLYDCWLLRMDEITFHDFLRIRQYPEYPHIDHELSAELQRHFESIYLRHSKNFNSR